MTTAAGRSGRIRFAPGDRVELTTITPGYAKFGLTEGQRGTVEFTDSLGTVHIRWDGGQRAGIIAEDATLLRAADHAAAPAGHNGEHHTG